MAKKPNPITAKLKVKKTSNGKTNPIAAKLAAKKATKPEPAVAEKKTGFKLKYDPLAQRKKDIQKRIDTAIVAYEEAMAQDERIYKKLDKAKPGTDRFLGLKEEWTRAANISDRRMNAVLNLTAQLRRLESNGSKGGGNGRWIERPTKKKRAKNTSSSAPTGRPGATRFSGDSKPQPKSKPKQQSSRTTVGTAAPGKQARTTTKAPKPAARRRRRR